MTYHPFELKIEQLETLNFELETIRSQETAKAIKGGWCGTPTPGGVPVRGISLGMPNLPGENGGTWPAAKCVTPTPGGVPVRPVRGAISLGMVLPGENGDAVVR